jgi:phosphate-selective porin OprO/OprP
MKRIAIFSLSSVLLGALPLATGAASAQAPRVAAQDSVGTAASAPTVAELDQRVHELERQLQAQSAALAAMPRVDVGAEGLRVRSADAFQIRIHGYVQEDGRFLGAGTAPGSSTFLLRRVRPTVDGTFFGDYDFRLMADFGEGKASIQDAYLDARVVPQLRVRVGKFRPPVGLEWLQSATTLFFGERGFASSLLPNRDIGVQVGGELAGGVVSYAAGVFNGVPDGGSSDGDADRGKDAAGRIFVQPFRHSGVDLLSGLGLGMGATVGRQTATTSATSLAAYRTPGLVSFFGYRGDGTAAGTTLAAGRRTRLTPQGDYYAGPLGVIAEYVVSSQRVRRDAETALLQNRAWNVVGGLVLTGEDASYGGVKPRRSFDPAKRTFGAVEVVGRAQALELDEAAFPIFADAATAARAAHAWGAGVNWYLNANVKLSADYERTRFEGGSGAGDRAAERVLLTRVQVAF